MLQLKDNPMKSDIDTIQYLSKQGDPLAKGLLSNMLTAAKNHLVQVQKTVTRAGKTFLQNFWINPDDAPSEQQIKKTIEMLGLVTIPNSPFAQWSKQLSDKDYGIIKDYTSNSFYKELNALLRNKPVTKKSGLSLEALKERATIIENALDKFDLPQDLVAYRIMDEGFQDKLKVGEILHDKGFTSTSICKYAETKPGYTYLKIHIPKGKGRGAWIAPISWIHDEEEFLLNRGTQFKITRVKKNKDGSQFAECEVIDRQPGNLDDMKKSIKSDKIQTKRLDKFTWTLDDVEILKSRE